MRLEAIATWGALVAWTVVIWGLGGDGFSSDSTSRFLRPLLEWLFPGAATESLGMAHSMIRKTSHIFEYGVLTLLTMRAVHGTRALPTRLGLAIALGFALTLAVVDEGRQAGSTVREGAWTDVLLDMVGAGGATVIVLVLPSWSKRLLVGRED